ncbi:MAG: exo-alpha-sialidase [Acidobacteria bacterium]|nr:exo-alpha-sialidase [Acidobacteriota bacterium]
MRIVSTGILARGEARTARAAATFPSITVLPDGEILAVYRIGPSKESEGARVEIRRSLDGNAWGEPEAPFADTFGGVRGSHQVIYLTALGGRRVLACACWVDREAFPGKPLFNPETEGCLPMHILVADSADGARTFSPWRRVALPDDVGPASLTNPVLRLADGRLAISIETNKTYEDRGPWRQRVVYVYSSDEGQTWSEPVTTCEDPAGRIFHWDQRAAVCSGRLVTFSWTYDKPANRYLNIRRHLDGVLHDTLPFADQPAHPAVLRGGELVLPWVDRYGTQSIRARHAAAADAPFPQDRELVIYSHDQAAASTGGTAEMLEDMGRWSFGLPYAGTLPSGDVMIVYYAGTPAALDIRYAILQVNP